MGGPNHSHKIQLKLISVGLALRHPYYTYTSSYELPEDNWGVTIHWIGLLDWTTGLTQNGVKCFFQPFSV